MVTGSPRKLLRVMRQARPTRCSSNRPLRVATQARWSIVHPPDRACITCTRLPGCSGIGQRHAVVAAPAVDEDHDVGPQVALVVEHVAAQARVDGEGGFQRRPQRDRVAAQFRRGREAAQLGREGHGRHGADDGAAPARCATGASPCRDPCRSFVGPSEGRRQRHDHAPHHLGQQTRHRSRCLGEGPLRCWWPAPPAGAAPGRPAARRPVQAAGQFVGHRMARQHRWRSRGRCSSRLMIDRRAGLHHHLQLQPGARASSSSRLHSGLGGTGSTSGTPAKAASRVLAGSAWSGQVRCHGCQRRPQHRRPADHAQRRVEQRAVAVAAARPVAVEHRQVDPAVGQRGSPGHRCSPHAPAVAVAGAGCASAAHSALASVADSDGTSPSVTGPPATPARLAHR
jgi:hypothetical protein